MKLSIFFVIFLTNIYACTGGCITPSVGKAAKKSIETSFKSADKMLEVTMKALKTSIDSLKMQDEIEIKRAEKIFNLAKFNLLNLKNLPML